MTEEVQAALAEVPAPEQVATAAPEAEVSTPEAEQAKEAPKLFSQEDLDAAIGKRLAREQRKWEREAAARLAEMQSVPAQDGQPPEEALRLAEQIAQQREEARQRAQIESAYREREDDTRDKYADFDAVAYNPQVPITKAMAETIFESESGPELAYYLGSNPAEAKRIARLSPFLQAKELGRLEVKLQSAPPPRVSNAPPPISPVAARSTGAPSFDTTDPRSVSSMSTSEWIEAERQRQVRKSQAQHTR